MPLFDVELNRLADSVGASDLTIYLHTAEPTNGDPTNGRTTTGGGAFVNGATLTAGNISAASNGDISNDVAVSFGNANADVGTVAWWSAMRGNSPVGYGTLPSSLISIDEPFSINAGSLQFNGS